MTKGFEIEFDKPGFPIRIGGVEFWFDDKLESVRRFLDSDENIQQKVEKLKEEANAINLPASLDDANSINIDVDDYDAGLNLLRQVLTIQYDEILGDGSFDKIYEKNEDMKQLRDIFPVLTQSIAATIARLEQERPDKLEKKMAEVLKKKAKKK